MAVRALSQAGSQAPCSRTGDLVAADAGADGSPANDWAHPHDLRPAERGRHRVAPNRADRLNRILADLILLTVIVALPVAVLIYP